jgi:Putative transposase/Transposase zinc-binding domain
MRYRHPLKRILHENRNLWDVESTRSAVRSAFKKALECGTAALGAEVYSSGIEERVVFHTCKGRACSSCGARATSQWQRERWAALPDVPYKGITFTMPDILWPFFRNRQLARLLPVLAAKTVEAWVRARFGLKVGVIAIPHTFNGRLDFNAHVHVMVTAGGLELSGEWRGNVYYDVDALTHYWRKAVIRVLRASLRAGTLTTKTPAEQIDATLTTQENRWWSVKLQSLGSKEHFLRYAGRYARRPPIAQRRIIGISKQEIQFWAKDRRLRRQVLVCMTPKEFLAAWMQHIPERYEHAVRSFGLFAPRAIGDSSAAVSAILAQSPRRRPRPLSWSLSIRRDFGWDPLLDRQGNRMTWNRRIAPQKA